MTATIIIAAVAAVIAIVAAWMLGGNKVKAEYQQKISALEGELIRKEAEANSEKQLRESEKKNHEESFKSLKEAQEQALAATKAQLVTESERQMKQREESLKQEAAEAIKNITGDLNKDIKAMTEAFEKQKEAQNTAKAEIKTQFDETVKHLKEQTESIGNTADNLAQALKGKNKMQGIFGETILGNILKAEGLVEGRDYESEVTLRDSKGRTIKNENSGSKMRPDFVLHYPNGIDALLDSKVSLSALSDYFAAESDEQREDAAKRNLASVWKHVEELAGKEYQRYVVGRQTLDLVIMFIPNYAAYQLAKMKNENIFSEALQKKVLITTEETLIPFLTLIHSARLQKEQMANVEKIMQAAHDVVERVGIFYKSQIALEGKIEAALTSCRENTRRLVDGNQSIVKAARRAIGYGVEKPTTDNALPEPETPLLED